MKKIGMKTILGVCAVVMFAVLVVWLTSCINRKVIRGVNRHEMLKEYNCYDVTTLNAGSGYVDIRNTDLCLEIAYSDTLLGGNDE